MVLFGISITARHLWPGITYGEKRDDFSSATIENLRARVNNSCSNPGCRVPTTGPSEDPEKVNNIGVAAHITAAAPGGPRYDEYLSSNQRRNIRNGIYQINLYPDIPRSMLAFHPAYGRGLS